MEHEWVFAADDTGSDDGPRPWQFVDCEEFVAVVNSNWREVDAIRVPGLRPGCDQDELRFDAHDTLDSPDGVGAFDHRMFVAVDHAVAFEIVTDPGSLTVADCVRPRDQLAERCIPVEFHGDTIQLARPLSGKKHGRLPERLASQGACLHGSTTRIGLFLEHDHAFAEESGLGGHFISGRPGPDDS